MQCYERDIMIRRRKRRRVQKWSQSYFKWIQLSKPFKFSLKRSISPNALRRLENKVKKWWFCWGNYGKFNKNYPEQKMLNLKYSKDIWKFTQNTFKYVLCSDSTRLMKFPLSSIFDCEDRENFGLKVQFFCSSLNMNFRDFVCKLFYKSILIKWNEYTHQMNYANFKLPHMWLGWFCKLIHPFL